MDEFIPPPLINSFMNDASWGPVADIPWIDDGMSVSYDPEISANSTSLDTFIQGYNWSLPACSSDGQFSQIEPSSFVNNPMAGHVKVGHDLMSDTPSSTFAGKALDPRIFLKNREGGEGSTNSNLMDLRPKSENAPKKSGILSSELSLSGRGDHYQRMQELYELGMKLNTQVFGNEDYLQTQLSTNSAIPCEQFVGDILKSSVTFLKILRSFYSPATVSHSIPITSGFDSCDGEISPSEASTFSDFSDIATTTTTTTATSVGNCSQNHQGKQVGPSTSHPQCKNNVENFKPVTADMTTILQLLTCYIRIIHLHSIFYTQVHDCLTAPLTHKQQNPLPPIIPGMQVGGLLLDDFPNFQIKLLLQISTHVLGEIEKALGLPDGYRISKKKSVQSKGILETSVSVQFVEMTMRENVGTGSMGIEKDQIKSIRDKLGSLRVLLKGTINI